jgi:isochorismate synthase EntC
MPEVTSSSSAGLAALAAAAGRALGRAEATVGSADDGAVVFCEPIQEALTHALLAVLGQRAGTMQRCALAGDGVFFCGVGVGVAAAADSDDDIKALNRLTQREGRRVVVALPFVPEAHAADDSWRHLRRQRLWAPRVFVHASRQQADAVVGVDLGDGGDAAGRRRALQEAQAIVLTLTTPCDDVASAVPVPPWSSLPTADEHRQAVEAAVAAMGAPDDTDGTRLSKVVLARRRRATLLSSPTKGSRAALAARLFASFETSNTVEVTYLVGDGDDVVVGCTPERLVSRQGTTVSVDVLAGTARLGHDDVLGADKERREHEAVKAFVRECFGSIGATVQAPDAPQWRRLQVVQHLWTPVTATLPTSSPVFQVLHPTPAVAGVPTAAATARIAASEGFDRGLYCGAIGIATADGEDLWVGLRCAHLHAGDGVEGGVIDVFAGGGIVVGSDPAAEWRELDDKERTIQDALRRVQEASP